MRMEAILGTKDSNSGEKHSFCCLFYTDFILHYWETLAYITQFVYTTLNCVLTIATLFLEIYLYYFERVGCKDTYFLVGNPYY
jgi:hypothetical protein